MNKNKNEENSEEYMKYLRNNTMQTSQRMYTVHGLYTDVENGTIIINHDYQRKKDQWNDELEKGLLLTWLEGYPTPPIILARVDKDNKTVYELIDGQQRENVAHKWITNKIRLPKHLPKDIAGGRNRKSVSSEIRERIDGANIPAVIVDPTADYQIKEIYGRVQKGVRLTVGQELRWQYGDIKQVIRELSKHPITNHVFAHGDDYNLAVAGYIIEGIVAPLEKRKTEYKKAHIIKTMGKYRDYPNILDIKKECFLRADYMNTIFEKSGIDNVIILNVLALQELLNIYKDKNSKIIQDKLIQAWKTFITKVNRARELKKSKVISMNANKEEWERNKLLQYYDIADKNALSSHKVIDERRVILQKEYEALI